MDTHVHDHINYPAGYTANAPASVPSASCLNIPQVILKCVLNMHLMEYPKIGEEAQGGPSDGGGGKRDTDKGKVFLTYLFTLCVTAAFVAQRERLVVNASLGPPTRLVLHVTLHGMTSL